MRIFVHMWSYLTDILLKWEIFQTKVVDKIKIHILYSVSSSRKSCKLWDNVEKYAWAIQDTDDDIIWCMHAG